MGARALALSNAICGCPGVFALSANPSGLASNTAPTLAAYATRLYGQEDLSFVCAEMHLGHLGICASSFGGELYRESVLYVGGGLSAHGLSLGASAKVMALSVRNYGSAAVVGLDAGVLGSVNESLRIAVVGKNLNLPSIASAREEIPSVIKLGAAAALSPSTVLSVDLAREERRGMNLSIGQSSVVGRYLALRSGISTNPAAFSGGFGVFARRVTVDYSVMMHRPLGLTHGLTVCYTLARR